MGSCRRSCSDVIVEANHENFKPCSLGPFCSVDAVPKPTETKGSVQGVERVCILKKLLFDQVHVSVCLCQLDTRRKIQNGGKNRCFLWTTRWLSFWNVCLSNTGIGIWIRSEHGRPYNICTAKNSRGRVALLDRPDC